MHWIAPSEKDTATVPLINARYIEVWGPLHNFFLPSTKLIEKTRDGARILRKHDAPQTAYQRLLASGELSRPARRTLRAQYESLDPFALAKELNPRLKKILN